jgi:nitrate/TMAO reductase-like tetraheme cytochrome c subunit
MTCKEEFNGSKKSTTCPDCKLDRKITRKAKELVQQDIDYWYNNTRTPDPIEDEANY